VTKARTIITHHSYVYLTSRPGEGEHYGVTTISRLLKIIGLFCRIYLFYRAVLQKRPVIIRSLLIIEIRNGFPHGFFYGLIAWKSL